MPPTGPRAFSSCSPDAHHTAAEGLARLAVRVRPEVGRTRHAMHQEEQPEMAPELTQDAPAIDATRIAEVAQSAAPVSELARRAKVFAVEGLDVSYSGKLALEGATLDIAERSVTAFIGPSGCGKSTFLRSINRMNDTIPSCRITGKIEIDGRDIYDKSLDVVQLRARIGMVFQKPNPFPKSIYENVAYGPKIHGLAKNKTELEEIVVTSLKKAGLFEEVKDRLDHPGTGLSGGQQQRLCIARAIAVNPEVILMDEPCSALDPIATARIEELIDELRQNFCIVIVTHSMQQAARVSQLTAFFHLGNLVEVGDTDDIFTAPKDKRTQDYITGRFG